jgi:hypothetical protein
VLVVDVHQVQQVAVDVEQALDLVAVRHVEAPGAEGRGEQGVADALVDLPVEVVALDVEELEAVAVVVVWAGWWSWSHRPPRAACRLLSGSRKT